MVHLKWTFRKVRTLGIVPTNQRREFLEVVSKL
jgi:hypothetical protein